MMDWKKYNLNVGDVISFNYGSSDNVGEIVRLTLSGVPTVKITHDSVSRLFVGKTMTVPIYNDENTVSIISRKVVPLHPNPFVPFVSVDKPEKELGDVEFNLKSNVRVTTNKNFLQRLKYLFTNQW